MLRVATSISWRVVSRAGARRVFHLAVFVEHFFDVGNHFGVGGHVFAHAAQGGVGCFFALFFFVGIASEEEVHKFKHGFQRAFEVEEFAFFQICSFGAYAEQCLSHVEKRFFINVFFVGFERGKFLCARQLLHNFRAVAAEAHAAVHPFGAKRAHTSAFQQCAYVRKAYFLFKCGGINHRLYYFGANLQKLFRKRARFCQKKFVPFEKKEFRRDSRGGIAPKWSLFVELNA